jgi:putative Mn2+ efflux pump MntP
MLSQILKELFVQNDFVYASEKWLGCVIFRMLGFCYLVVSL